MRPAKKRRRATYKDLVALPDNVIGELIDGELFASPRPASLHAFATSSLYGLVHRFHRGGGGSGDWWILFEPELHLGPSVLVPDLAGWRLARMPVYPLKAFFTVAPDWICEVLSPGTARLDLHLKLPKYAHAGVAHAWILDPANRTLQVLRREHESWVIAAVYGDGDNVRAEPFTDLEFRLDTLWPVEAQEEEARYPAPSKRPGTKRRPKPRARRTSRART